MGVRLEARRPARDIVSTSDQDALTSARILTTAGRSDVLVGRRSPAKRPDGELYRVASAKAHPSGARRRGSGTGRIYRAA